MKPWDGRSRSEPVTGAVVVNVTASSGGTTFIEYADAGFSSPPQIHVSKQGAALAKFIPYASAIGTDAATIGIFSGDGSTTTGSVTVAWMAVPA